MMERFWNGVCRIVEFFLKLLYRLLHKEPEGPAFEKTLETLTQFVKFGLVGVSNTLFEYIVYLLVLFSLQGLGWLPDYDYVAANIVGFILSVLWAFYWNNKYVFEAKEKQRSLGKTLLKTYCSYAFSGLVVKNILSYLFIEILHISKIVAPLLSLIITVPLNFLMNKFWAFKE